MSRLHFINIKKDYDVPFHALLLNLSAFNERQEIHALSNFSLNYDLHLLSNFRECSKRRQIMSRMHRERQSYILDVVEDYVDKISGERAYIFKGTIGFIKVNRVNKDASLIYLIDRSLLNDLSFCFQQVLDFAKRQGYSLYRIYCRVIVDTAGEMIIPILTATSFYKMDEAVENDLLIISFAREVSTNSSPFRSFNAKHDKSAFRVNSFSPHSRYGAQSTAWQLTPSASAAMATVNGAKYFYPIVSPMMSPEGIYPYNFNATDPNSTRLSSIDTERPSCHPKYAYNIVDTDSIDSKSRSTHSDSSNQDYIESDMSRPSIDPSIYNIPATPPASPISSVSWERETNTNDYNKYNKCCIFWLKGVCMYGSNCHYRHSVTPDVEQLYIDIGESGAVSEQVEEDAIPDGLSGSYGLFLDFVNNANSNWLSGLRCPFPGNEQDASAITGVECIDAPSMSTMRGELLKASTGDKLSATNVKPCYSSITADMVDSLVNCRQIARERIGPAGMPFSSVEECLEVLGIDPVWMNSVLLLNKDICSEYRNVVRTFLRTDANYPGTMPDSSYAAEPFSGPMPAIPAQLYNVGRNASHSQFMTAPTADHKQYYPYQQQMVPQWNYMYYSPISPQPPTGAASLLYAAPTAIPAGVPSAPVSSQNRMSTCTDSSGIKYRKPCEFKPQDHRPSSAALPAQAQESVSPSMESTPALVAAAEKAPTDHESAPAPPSEESHQENDTKIEGAASSHPPGQIL